MRSTAWRAAIDGRRLRASFIKDYVHDLIPGEEQILGTHMLAVCPPTTTTTPSLEIAPFSISGREDPVRLCFVADAGPGLVFGVSDLGDRFRITLNESAAYYRLAAQL